MTGEVFVSFVVNTEGKLVVIDCNSANQELRNYVLGRLERVDIGDNPTAFGRPRACGSSSVRNA